jgi:hypothetical protein
MNCTPDNEFQNGLLGPLSPQLRPPRPRSAMTASRRHQTVAGKPRRTCKAVCASSPGRAVASFPQIEGLVAGLADGVTPHPGRPWPQKRTDRYAASFARSLRVTRRISSLTGGSTITYQFVT